MIIEDIFILPIGSYEYHGAEMPADTDSVIAQHIAKDFAKNFQVKFSGRVTLLPVFNFGLSLEHKGFPQTAYVSHRTFYKFIWELLDSIAKDNTILFVVNGHGGNIHTLSSLEADFNYVHKTCKLIASLIYAYTIKDLCIDLFGEFDVHAGSIEASLMAFYQNQSKREYTISGLSPKEFSGSLRFFRTIELYPQGVIKKLPIVIADPVKGKILHDAILNQLHIDLSTLLLRLNNFS